MDQVEWNTYTVQQLQQEIRNLQIACIPKAKQQCIEVLVKHYRENGSLIDWDNQQAQESSDTEHLPDATSQVLKNNPVASIPSNTVIEEPLQTSCPPQNFTNRNINMNQTQTSNMDYLSQLYMKMDLSMQRQQEMFNLSMQKQQEMFSQLVTTLSNNHKSLQSQPQDIPPVEVPQETDLQERFSSASANAINFL